MEQLSNEEIANTYKSLCKMAIGYVEELARTILIENKDLKEFVMAMGSYSFTDKQGKNIDTISSEYINYRYVYSDSAPYFKELNDFMQEWDDVLKISGNPMRFMAYSNVITDW